MKYSAIAFGIIIMLSMAAFAGLDDGIVAQWDFDEGQGAVLADKSGKGNDGKIHGAEWVKAGNGHALKFDGVDDYVDCGAGSSLNLSGPMTLEAWVFLGSAPEKDEAGIIGKCYTSYALSYCSNNRCYWYISTGANTRRTEPIEAGSWHHIVGTFDGDTANPAMMHLYLDGELVDSKASKCKAANRGENFLMGCMVHNPAEKDPGQSNIPHFKGLIDRAKVYNRVLSEMEIRDSYNQRAEEKGLVKSSATREAPKPSNPLKRELLGLWDFDEGEGNDLHDKSGKNNHGKIHGAEWVKVGNGYALRFDGVDDYVNCGNSPSLIVDGPVTLEAWVYPEAVSATDAGIAGKSFGGYALTQSKRNLYWYISGGANHISEGLKIGEWQHVAGVFDGTDLTIYVNGKPVQARETTIETVGEGGNFSMGCVLGSTSAANPALNGTVYFAGMIDDVRVHRGVLSEKELSAHYNETAEERGKALAQDLLFEKFKLTPYLYADKKELVVKVDFRGFLPLPAGAHITAELARGGEEKPLQAHAVDAEPQPGYSEVTFSFSGLAQGKYEVRAILKDGAGVKSMEKLGLQLPPSQSELPAPKARVVAALPPSLEPMPYQIEMCNGGGFKMLVQGEALPVASTFSYPNGGENAFLASSQKGPQCEPSWNVTSRKVAAKKYEVVARGQYYTIDRKIELRPSHVLVTDKITNLTDKDIGIIIDNYLDTGEGFPTSYMGGVDARGEYEALHNPTTFVAREGLGLGMVAMDDVYVVHGSLHSKENGRAGIQDDQFGLGPNASYTMTWSIYPVPSDDYFDFINVLRNDLGVNGKTVDGPLTYFNRKEPIPEKLLQDLQSKYICTGCLAWSADDPGISIEGIEFIDFPKERAHVKKLFAEIRAKFPTPIPCSTLPTACTLRTSLSDTLTPASSMSEASRPSIPVAGPTWDNTSARSGWTKAGDGISSIPPWTTASARPCCTPLT